MTQPQDQAQAHAPDSVAVFYDGACPLCTAEIDFYRTKSGSERIEWIDVSACHDAEVAPGLSRDTALRRFHVQTASGEIISGGRAFATLWTALPGFRFLGRLFQSGPLAWVIDRAYDGFLRWRPRLQAWVRRRRDRAGRQDGEAQAPPSSDRAIRPVIRSGRSDMA